MKIQEGPAFSALVIGAGIAYLTWNETQNILLASLVGIAVALADYFLLIWIQKFKSKK